MAADLSLAWDLSTSHPLRFSLKIQLGGPKGSVLLGCSYSGGEILTQLLSACFLMQPPLSALQAPSQRSQVVMLSVWGALWPQPAFGVGLEEPCGPVFCLTFWQNLPLAC